MARNKSSMFGAADGLFSADSLNEQASLSNAQEVQEVQQVQEVQEVHEVHVQDTVMKKKLGSTQGRKGVKLKRINLAFDDMNYEYIRLEAKRRGKTITEFVNGIIEDYRVSEKGIISDSNIH